MEARISNPIWPERHAKAIGAIFASLTAIGFAGWIFYIESAVKPAADGTVNVLNADIGANCGAPKENILNWVRSACAGKQECVLTFNDKSLAIPLPTCSSQLRIEWTCARAGNISSYIAPWDTHKDARVLLSCAKKR